jgi:hypothetical protein
MWLSNIVTSKGGHRVHCSSVPAALGLLPGDRETEPRLGIEALSGSHASQAAEKWGQPPSSLQIRAIQVTSSLQPSQTPEPRPPTLLSQIPDVQR